MEENLDQSYLSFDTHTTSFKSETCELLAFKEYIFSSKMAACLHNANLYLRNSGQAAIERQIII